MLGRAAMRAGDGLPVAYPAPGGVQVQGGQDRKSSIPYVLVSTPRNRVARNVPAPGIAIAHPSTGPGRCPVASCRPGREEVTQDVRRLRVSWHLHAMPAALTRRPIRCRSNQCGQRRRTGRSGPVPCATQPHPRGPGRAWRYPSAARALRNMRSQGEASGHPAGDQLKLALRGVRSGCGIRIVARPSSLHRPAIASVEPLGFAG